MLFDLTTLGSLSLGKVTQTADTVITQLVPPVKGAYAALARVQYLASTTAHTLTVLRPLNWTTFSADAAAGQAVVNLLEDPGSYSTTWAGRIGPAGATPSTANNGIAANDFVVYELPDGNYVMDTVSSVSSLAITLATNVPTGGVKKGGRLWFFGITTDTSPQTKKAHTQFTLAASATTTLAKKQGVFYRSLNRYDPLILHSDNATAAGTLERTTVLYLKY